MSGPAVRKPDTATVDRVNAAIAAGRVADALEEVLCEAAMLIASQGESAERTRLVCWLAGALPAAVLSARLTLVRREAQHA